MTQSRIALILGATGGVGGETARALARHGWRIRALTRDVDAAAERSSDIGWTWTPGDAMDRTSVVRAAEGAQLIVHAVNPPGYRKWGELVLPMIDNTIAAARASGARVLLPGTIYNYGPDAFPLLHENSPQHPTTRKGEIRVAMEKRLEDAAEDGVRSLILRAGDFFGPRPGNNWFSQALVKPGQAVRSVTYPGRCGVGHTWAYLPDVAETFALLVEREADLATFERVHFEGFWDADGGGMAAAIKRATGTPDLKTAAFPWWALSLMAPFNETMRELGLMKHLWRAPIRLGNDRLKALLGTEPRTPIEAAVLASLAGIGSLPTMSAAIPTGLFAETESPVALS